MITIPFTGLENVRSQVGDSQQKIKKGTGKQHQCEKEVQNKAEGAANNSNTVDSKLKHSTGDGNNDAVEELVARSREGDLRAELSRRRAERLTKVSLYDLFKSKVDHFWLIKVLNYLFCVEICTDNIITSRELL